MLGRALKMALWVTYDHLGKLILANLVCMAGLFIPGLLAMTALAAEHTGTQWAIGAPTAVLTVVVLAPLAAVALAHLAKELIDNRDGALRDLWTGVQIYGWRAVGLGALYAGAVCCLLSSAWFYSNVFRETLPWLGFTLTALALWCLAYVTLVWMLAIPTLVQKNGAVRQTVKLSALLVLDNPVFALGLAIQLGALGLISVPMLPLMIFLSGSVAAVLLTSAYEQLARKYALMEMRKAGVHAPDTGMPLEGFGPGVRVISREGVLEVDETQDDYLNRGLRDFMFPWKG